MSMQFYTYLHCRPDGMPFYVGKGNGNRAKRVTGSDRNNHHQNIVKKHGASNILVYTFPCNSEQQAFADEIQQIAQFRREGYELCNQTDGGEGISGLKHSLESRVKMKGKKRSLEACANISAAKKNPSAETRSRISASKKGKSSWNKGISPTAETREKLSIFNRGKNIHKKHEKNYLHRYLGIRMQLAIKMQVASARQSSAPGLQKE